MMALAGPLHRHLRHNEAYHAELLLRFSDPGTATFQILPATGLHLRRGGGDAARLRLPRFQFGGGEPEGWFGFLFVFHFEYE